MLSLAASSIAALAVVHPTPADARLGVYILATVFGLLVCGIVSCIKEMRAERAVSL